MHWRCMPVRSSSSPRSRSARSEHCARPPSSLEAAAHLAELAAAGDVLVQPLATAVLRDGESSLIYFGGEFSHAIRKVPADGDYRVQEHHGGRVVPHEPTDDEFATAAAALAAAPAATAYARVDLVQVDGCAAVMELEAIEPQLFFDHDAHAAGRFAAHLATLLR